MSAVSRSPSSTMIPRFSDTCRIARSTWGRRRDRREDDLVEPPPDELREADDRCQRRSQLVADIRQERALGGGRRLGRAAARASSIAAARAAVRSATRRSSALASALRPRHRAGRSRRPAAMRLPTVYSSGPSPGCTSRPVRRLSTARTPIVRPLVTSGVPRNEVTSEQPGEGAVALVRVLVDVAEDQRPVGQWQSWTSWDVAEVEPQRDRPTCGRHLRRCRRPTAPRPGRRSRPPSARRRAGPGRGRSGGSRVSRPRGSGRAARRGPSVEAVGDCRAR